MKKNKSSESATIRQTFTFRAPGALSVMLAGDFTRWQEGAIQMKQQAGGLWKATVDLSPGNYHYRFLVDGQWRDDPECTLRVPNPYGGENSVREVA